MKIIKITYWVSSLLISAMMAMGGVMYLSKKPEIMQEIAKVGYPYFFFQLLGVFKILGVIALLQPKDKNLKEWAYAGFTFTLIGAIWTHIATNTSVASPLVALAILSVSYWAHHRLSKKQCCNTSEKC